ncbi:hypothetical protein P152DRAFT_461266 [Eremomyces bilateralis CBS 781.70]|uniref:Uncharacterized protein n=1 Tax=Eremomyces bilateralis CBS 781.70 TaxID=1392243 RepID=A0A6G1FUZ9_9PEZI|nr:uncharacterized protein P152DRAFT_461266 [Eremomyces bilateralis CBS 781.70]KAF1809580.1 hypothetical protein P152DRAFT_461266 [Eremomyces bilateralis CBS 781.70]
MPIFVSLRRLVHDSSISITNPYVVDFFDRLAASYSMVGHLDTLPSTIPSATAWTTHELRRN